MRNLVRRKAVIVKCSAQPRSLDIECWSINQTGTLTGLSMRNPPRKGREGRYTKKSVGKKEVVRIKKQERVDGNFCIWARPSQQFAAE